MQKFTSPNLPRDLIQRTQLESVLMDGLKNKARLFLISAPAGYGKSTLIANWVSTNNIEHLWFNLEPRDNELPVFLDALREGLQMEALGQPNRKVPSIEETDEINTLVKHIQQREKTFLLVFDRLDNVSNTRIQDFLFELATQLNPHAVVVLISRRQPALQVSRMRAYNQLVEINESNLEFTPHEIKEFLRLETGGVVPDRNLKRIEQKTRGWAAGLRLAVDLLDGDLLSDGNPGIAHLNGAQRYLADYFEEEVYAELEPALQDFLVRSSVLDQFSTTLCRVAVKNRNTEALLQRLQGDHLFILPVENQPGWFRYHPLFRDFLLSKCALETQREILWKAAMWFEQQGQLNEAVDYILRTGQESDALQIIEPACEQAILNGNLQAILDWLAEWARVGFQPRGELLVYQGWIKALGGDFVQALMLAEQAAELLKTYGKSKDKQIAATLQITQGKLAALHAFIDVMYTRQYDSALKQAKTAQHLLPKNRSAWTLMALWAQAETQKRIDHISKAIQTLYEALRIGKTVGGKTFYFAIISSLAAALHFNGQRGEAIEVCQKALRHGSEADDPSTGGIYAWLGRMALEANQLDEALQLIEQGLALTQKSGVTLNLIFAYYYASLVHQAAGDHSLALDLIHKAQNLAGNASLSDERWLDAWETNLHLSDGNLIKVEHWVRRENLNLNLKPDYLNMESLLVYTRYLIKTGEMNSAGKLLREMEKQASRRGYYRWLLNIYLQQAIIWEHAGKNSAALDCIKRALHIAAPEEYQRAFLDEPAPALKLVQELSAEAPAFVMRLLRSASTNANDSRTIPASILPEPLSEREMDVLKLLASGRKGPQIAPELFISYSTVRTHLKSIYRKLDVHNRQDLLDKARLLELV
jgi:LuxR family maltose regulon positive regulatory protein